MKINEYINKIKINKSINQSILTSNMWGPSMVHPTMGAHGGHVTNTDPLWPQFRLSLPPGSGDSRKKSPNSVAFLLGWYPI